MVTIGLDPHPDSHTVAALEDNGTTLAFLTVTNDAEGLMLLHRFALPFPERRWAVEGAANRYILPFVSELLEPDSAWSSMCPNRRLASRHSKAPCVVRELSAEKCNARSGSEK